MSEINATQFPVRQYRCGTCGSDFPTYNDCISHMRIHSIESNNSAADTNSAVSKEQKTCQTLEENCSVMLFSEEESLLPPESTTSVVQLTSGSSTIEAEGTESKRTKPQVLETDAQHQRAGTLSLPVSTSEQDSILVQMDTSGVVNVQLEKRRPTELDCTSKPGNNSDADLANTDETNSTVKNTVSELSPAKQKVLTNKMKDKNESTKLDCDTQISVKLQKPKEEMVGVKQSNVKTKSEGRFCCSECPAKYRFLSSLSVHQKRHNGSQPYQCKMCNKKFWHPTNLRVHERVHTQERPFQCDVCGHGFNQANDLRIHRRIHTGEMPLKCPVSDCCRAFRDPSCLRRHMNKHKGVQPHIECDKCTAKFFHPSGLARHYKRHTGQKDYVCSICKAAFARGDTLKLHMRTHSGQKPYSCSVCRQAFSDRSYCRRHISKHSELQKPRVISALRSSYTIKQEPSEEVMEVVHAEDSLPNKADDSTDQHIVQKKVIVPVQIPDPNGSDIPYASIEIELPESDLTNGDNSQEIVYQYGDVLITISRSAMEMSEESAPRIGDSSRDAGEWVADDEILTATPEVLTLQQTEHQYSRVILSSKTEQKQVDLSGSEVTATDGQGQVTATLNPVAVNSEMATTQPLSEYNEIVSSIMESELLESKDSHLRILPSGKEKQRSPRVGEKRWPCPDCDAAFFHQAELKRHQTKHTGELPYQCTICGKRVRDPSNLKRHVRTHTGERPYSCNVCQKTFRQAGHLTAHLRIHTGQRPYKCDICTATFIEANHLRYHKKVHAGIKPYRCSECDLSFIRNAELKRHMHVHGGEGNLKCHLCPAKFFRSDALKQHLSKRHDQNPPFQCGVCSQAFFRQSLLDRHRASMKHYETVDVKNKMAASKSDVENSVAADALCELATGRRSAVTGVNGSSVVSSPTTLTISTSKTDSSTQAGDSSSSILTSKCEAPVGKKTTRTTSDQSTGTESSVLTNKSRLVRESFTASDRNSSVGNIVQQVMVDGGSVSGARVVLVESSLPTVSAELIGTGSQLSTTGQEQNIGDDILTSSTANLCVAMGGTSQQEQPPMTDKTKYIIINSPEDTVCTAPQLIHSESVEQQHSELIKVVDVSDSFFFANSTGSEFDHHTTQGLTVATSELSSDQKESDQNHVLVEAETSATVDGSQAALELTVQSILSGAAQLETVTPLNIKVRKSPRRQHIKSKGKISVKQEYEEVEPVQPKLSVAPLRTRSGRERKIKVKFSA